jgi:hypothetical protein
MIVIKLSINLAVMKSMYRAWSSDWAKSIIFSQDLINSKKWDAFKVFCEKQLGGNWRWELASNSEISSDISRHSFDSFK